MPAYVTRRAPGSPALPTRRIISYADKMLAALDLEEAELSVLLTGDARIHELNRVHRGKDRPTDVLAFALEEADGTETGDAALPYRVLGDVVISLDTAARQAAKARHSLEQEVCFLLAHGLLHLVGYDHQTDAQEARMNQEAARLLAASGAPGSAEAAAKAPPAPSRAPRSKPRGASRVGAPRARLPEEGPAQGARKPPARGRKAC